MNLPVSSGDLGIFFVKLLTKLVNLTKLDLNGVEDVKVYERYFYLHYFTKIVNFSYCIVLYGPLWRVRNKSGMSRGRYQEGHVKSDKSRVASKE